MQSFLQSETIHVCNISILLHTVSFTAYIPWVDKITNETMRKTEGEVIVMEQWERDKITVLSRPDIFHPRIKYFFLNFVSHTGFVV
jgi:hypothetical protein